MADAKTYANLQFAARGGPNPPRAEPNVTYMELKLKPAAEHRIPTGGLTSTYSELKFGSPVPRGDEDSPILSEGEDPPVSAWAGSQAQEGKEKAGRRCEICLACLLALVIVAVAVLVYYVIQTRHSLLVCEGNYRSLSEQRQEVNKTQRQCRQQVQELNATRNDCLKNLTASVTNVSVATRMHADLRQQFNQLENNYKSLNKTKARICELLMSSREQKCYQGWLKRNGACYFLSTVAKSQEEAMNDCAKNGSKLLEIHPSEEEDLFRELETRSDTYWVGNCGHSGPAERNLLHKTPAGECSSCASDPPHGSCFEKHYFICESSVVSCPLIPREAWDLCEKSPGPT